jgi:hypothetical protein
MGRIEGSRVDASSIPAGSKSTNNLWGKLTRRRAADAKRRRALELLADSADGCTEAIMVAHGFTVDMLVELINAGLATASADARSPADTRWRYPRADHGGGPAGARRTKRYSEAKFKKTQKAQQAKGCRLMSEYVAAGHAVRAKTARLGELRPAKEAADKKAGSKVVTKNKQRRAGSV